MSSSESRGESPISRRNFLRGIAATGLALATGAEILEHCEGGEKKVKKLKKMSPGVPSKRSPQPIEHNKVNLEIFSLPESEQKVIKNEAEKMLDGLDAEILFHLLTRKIGILPGLDKTISLRDSVVESFVHQEVFRILKKERKNMLYKKFSNNKREIDIYLRGAQEYAREYDDALSKSSKEHGVPIDILIGVLGVESGGNRFAKNKSGALGPMQFLATTAREFGLTVKKDIDERTNITKSIDAAAMYLKKLYGYYGQWYIALVAYSTGYSKLDREIITKFPKINKTNVHNPEVLQKSGVNMVTLYSKCFSFLGKYHPFQYPIWVSAMAPFVANNIREGEKAEIKKYNHVYK